MLLGVENKRKEKEELEPESSLRSEVNEIEERGISSLENCKDVAECSTSMTVDTLACGMTSDRRLKAHTLTNSRILEDGSMDYDSGHESVSLSSAFEFQKAERVSHRLPIMPFSKPAPSKWDDAEKWIASPTSNRPKTGQSVIQVGQAIASRKTGILSYGNRQSASKMVFEVPDPRIVAEEADTKRIDPSQAKREVGVQKYVNWVPEPYQVAESYTKPADSAISLNRHDSSGYVQSSTTFIPPPPTVRSVSMRDMGTEMTPVASQEPSRTGTPVRATTPMRSPSSSRPSTPGRVAPTSSPVESANCQVDPNKELSEKELQLKTRREIMVLGAQLGKMNIAAWASKEEEDKDASTSLKTVAMNQPTKTVIETRASAWEEAEKAKYMARFKREEIKIQAWENHQKAKTEAEMRKIEVEVERMRGRAHDKLMNKLAAARHKAEEKRAAAEAKRNRQAAKTEEQAEYIRRTGRIPSSFSCWDWCS
ncbi:remorin family protein isoform X2 [Tasmannia lanceolata]